jgi:hypothetical protein
MNEQGDQRERLARLLGEIAVGEGMQRTLIEGVEVFRATESVPRAPIVYQPRILIVGQGRKRAYLGGETYVYDAYNYLVLSVPLPRPSARPRRAPRSRSSSWPSTSRRRCSAR